MIFDRLVRIILTNKILHMKELNNSEIISISGGIIIAPTIVFAKFISGFISGIMDK